MCIGSCAGGTASLHALTVRGAAAAILAAIVVATPARASKVCLTGTSYQLRWGEQEGPQDLVTPWPPQWTSGPYCFKMDTEIGVSVVADPGENIKRWKLTGARLFSFYALDYLWTVGEGPWKEPGQTQALGDLPPWIDVVWLEGDVVIEMALPPPPPGGEDSAGVGGMAVTDSFSECSSIYVVLDQPKPPMANAWTGVLGYSCFWAMGEDTAAGANRALTDALWTNGTYNGGEEAYTTDETDSGETFHLKSFLNHPNCPWGQCNDFADFLICLSTSVGASDMRAQRSNAMVGPLYITNYLSPAGKPGGSFPWAYHQFALLSSNVWDGCINLYGYGVPKDWARDSTYQSQLVKHYNPSGTWLPTPSGGFTPLVTTNPPP